ncbi:MAG: hypothetical protein R2787_17165 [Saprospiraceae bacterium]
MRTIRFCTTLLTLGLLIQVSLLSSCKYAVTPDFRKTYADANAAVHSDTATGILFKVHLRNGDVCLMDDWQLTPGSDTISGTGRRYNFNRTLVSEGQQILPIPEIAIIETNQLDQIQSLDNRRLAALSVLTGLNLILDVICLSNPKACFGSCPTFYVPGYTDVHSASAEGFSRSIAPALEAADLDALQYQTGPGAFTLTLKNEAVETHIINQVALHAVPVEPGRTAFHAPDGQFYHSRAVQAPKQATVGDLDITGLLARQDEVEYFSRTDSLDLTTREELLLTFTPPPSSRAGVVVEFRQTLLTTFLLYSSLSDLGDEATDYLARAETDRRFRARFGQAFDRLGGIAIDWWDADRGTWQPVGQLEETGPIARNRMLLPLPPQASRQEEVTLRITATKGHWRFDQVALADIGQPVAPIVISPLEITTEQGSLARTADLLHDDQQALVTFPGDVYQIQFDLPDLPAGQQYELFLLSKGYYLEWIRKEWLADKNLPRLKRLLLRDNQTWQELAREYKAVEEDMEQVFWNSKYTRTQ